MSLFDYLCTDSLCIPLASGTANDALAEMAWTLATHGHISKMSVESVIEGLRNREELGSTGIFNSVAIPHVTSPHVDRMVATLGNHPHGIDFNSLDGQPVRLFFLVIRPTDNGKEYIRMLGEAARMLRDPALAKSLMEAESPWEVMDLLKDYESG